MKKLMIAISTIVLLIGCNRTAPPPHPIVGVVGSVYDTAYINALIPAVQTHLVKGEIIAKPVVDKLLAVQSLLSDNRLTLLVIVSTVPEDLSLIAAEVKKHNIGVVYIGTPPDKQLVTTNSRAVFIGYDVDKFESQIQPEEVDVLILRGGLNNPSDLQRFSALQRKVSTSKLQIKGVLSVPDVDRLKTRKIVYTYLKTHKGVSLILSTADSLTLGASDAIEQLKLKNIRAVGFGAPLGLPALVPAKNQENDTGPGPIGEIIGDICRKLWTATEDPTVVLAHESRWRLIEPRSPVSKLEN